MMAACNDGSSAAERKRERRLRSWCVCPGRSTPPLLRSPEVRHEGGGGCSARCRTRPDDCYGGPDTRYFTFDDEDVPAPQVKELQRIMVYAESPSLDVPRAAGE